MSDSGRAPAVEVRFASGLPGFPDARRFRLQDLEAHLRPFRRLQSVEDPSLGFTVVEPGLLFADYTIEIDEEHQSRLGTTAAEEILTLVLITVPRPPQQPTANLLGPIVINRTTGEAAQVVQHRSDHGVAEPLPGSAG